MTVTRADIDAFIDEELEKLKTYDGGRPPGHPYQFHLHVARVANSMRDLALAMDQGEARAHDLRRAALVHDAGKRLLPVDIWDTPGKPDDKVKKQRRRHTLLGVDIVNERFGAGTSDPFLDLIRDLMANHHECMDGSGWQKKGGDELSLEARMLCICDAFDGYSTWRPHFGQRDITPKSVIRRMAEEKKGQFDHGILKIFAKVKHAEI